jgi:hypothetical protein
LWAIARLRNNQSLPADDTGDEIIMKGTYFPAGNAHSEERTHPGCGY